MSKKDDGSSRRKLLKSIAAGSGAVVAGKTLPEKWTRPAIDSVLLPAHAQTSNPESPEAICTDLLRIEIQDGYSGSGTNPVLDDGGNPLNILVEENQAGGCPGEEPHYITAWGYYASAPSTPVYINTRVLWTTQDSNVAFIGSGPGILPQDNSFVTGVAAGQSTTLNASLLNFCIGIEGITVDIVTAAVTVNVGACPP